MSSITIVFIIICFIGLVLSIATVYHLSLFLSYYESTEQASKFFNAGQLIEERSTKWALFKDFVLLCVFILQHTVMALPSVKQAVELYGLGTLQRSIYVIATCISLQVLIRFWEPTPSNVWWTVIGSGSVVCILWRIIHICSWVVIYIGSVVLDLLELLGIRQVYYAIRNLPPPLHFKSGQLCRLYQHMRHPSFCSLCAIFWLCPVMTADRIMLAVTWTMYITVRWTVDRDDYLYQHEQRLRKTEQLTDLSYQYS